MVPNRRGMQALRGTLRRFLGSLTEDPYEIVRDQGLYACFPPDQWAGVMEARSIMNLDSRRSARFCQSLRHQAQGTQSVVALPEGNAAFPVPLDRPNCEGADLTRSGATCDRALANIEQALKSLHCTEALLAYLLVVRSDAPELFRQLFDQAKHTCEQALAKFGAPDCEMAEHCAAASAYISRAADILICRAITLDGAEPAEPLLSQGPPAMTDAAALARDRLQRVGVLLSLIRLFLSDDALASEDRMLVQTLALWSAALCEQARRVSENNSLGEAIDLAQAAEAIAQSARQLCMIDYSGKHNPT